MILNNRISQKNTDSEQPKSERMQYLFGEIQKAIERRIPFKIEKNEKYKIDPPQCQTDKGMTDFVGGMSFEQIENLVASETKIEFTANIEIDEKLYWFSFLKKTLCFLEKSGKIKCTITDNDKKNILNFRVEMIYTPTNRVDLGIFTVYVQKLIFESALNRKMISCSLAATIDRNKASFDIIMYYPLCSGFIDIFFNAEKKYKRQSIDNILDFFSLNEKIKNIFPSSVDLLESFNLEAFYLGIDTNSYTIGNVGFEISASKEWEIIKDKIKFLPSFQIDVDNASQSILLSAKGIWSLGSTKFNITLTSDLDFYVDLAEDSTLNFNDVVNLFAHDVSFPELNFSTFNLYANVNSSEYEFDIKTVDVYKFDIGSTSFELNQVSCFFSCKNESKEVKLSGKFCLGQTNFELEGNYSKDKSFTFTAQAINTQDKPLASFVRDVFEQLEINVNKNALPSFISDFKIKKIGFQYESEIKKISFDIEIGLGKVNFSIEFNNETKWNITFNPDITIDVLNLPVVGKLVKDFDSLDLNIEKNNNEKSDTDKQMSIENFEVVLANEKNKGVYSKLSCTAFGEQCQITIPLSESKEESAFEHKQKMLITNSDSSGLAFKGTIIWKNINKTILIFNLPRIGLGINDNGYIAALLDASLNISPLTISLYDAGIGVNMSALTKQSASEEDLIKFFISGFGISFDNGILSIGGGFYARDNEYAGELSIRFKEVGLTAIGSYSNETGSLWAFLVLSAPLGGIPAFFVKGLAAGFGYNKRLLLPGISEVNENPFVKAAQDGTASSEDFQKCIKDETNQYFLTAGVKFTSFQIINGVLLATISFGNECEIGLLGLVDISVPPNTGSGAKCLAKAQLAIEASLKPAEGVFRAEALLTNKSYILTEKCKLTGGFAAYVWFGENKYSGDFVVTLGGYHPSFVKPDHYPVVPRLGLNWQVDEHISIIGEMYFALTPQVLMAGGKLSLTYTHDNLKAWFIAYADMFMNWAPFSYDITIGVSVGVAYTAKFLGIQKTYSIEMDADLHLWGPELQGSVHIKWFIISFTISFSEGNDHSKDKLNWDGFVESFLVNNSEKNKEKKIYRKKSQNNEFDQNSDDILTISLDGVIRKITEDTNDTEVVSASQLRISLLSKIPMNKDKEGNYNEVYVRPACKSNQDTLIIKPKLTEPKLEKICKKNGILRYNKININDYFDSVDITQNVPVALWGKPSTDLINDTYSVVKDQCCGQKLFKDSQNDENLPNLFPKDTKTEKKWITLFDLYKKNTKKYGKCFKYVPNTKELNLAKYTIEEFKVNESNENIIKARNKLTNENICITEFVEYAENLFSEEFMTIN